jgi:phosphoenolpyruvate-protein kinase (PTS system EI component)
VLEGKEAYNVTQGICLPGHIVDADDLLCFEQHEAEPNFVSQLAVEGVVLATDVQPAAEVEDRIVLIPSADPGYDWLLARSIRGLVTMYGGANSHMAVRAAELGLPAAIGVGELVYQRLETARVIRIDCASRTVVPLS